MSTPGQERGADKLGNSRCPAEREGPAGSGDGDEEHWQDGRRGRGHGDRDRRRCCWGWRGGCQSCGSFVRSGINARCRGSWIGKSWFAFERMVHGSRMCNRCVEARKQPRPRHGLLSTVFLLSAVSQRQRHWARAPRRAAGRVSRFYSGRDGLDPALALHDARG